MHRHPSTSLVACAVWRGNPTHHIKGHRGLHCVIFPTKSSDNYLFISQKTQSIVVSDFLRMSSTTVNVEGIDHQTSDKEIRDFFSFCGKIKDITVNPGSGGDSTKSATVTFEKETAAKTALLLDNTQLGRAQVHVSSESKGTEQTSEGEKAEGEEFSQEDKPRSRILAEYLAHGYHISDQVIARGLALDQQHGISNRFMKALSDFDSKYKATERAQAVDDKYKVSDRAQSAWLGLNSYFDKAVNTPTGQRLRGFYEQGQKQVLDVHNEARHLADLKKQHGSGLKAEPVSEGSSRTTCNCGADSGVCPCAPGTCACERCAKNPDEKKGDGEKAGSATTTTEG
jgi:hypothetical protein